MANETSDERVTLVSSDGFEFIVDQEVAMVSGKNFVEKKTIIIFLKKIFTFFKKNLKTFFLFIIHCFSIHFQFSFDFL